MQYLLLGTLNQRDAPELYAPGPKAYKMLKGAVVGGPSLVFSRMQEAGVTRIHLQKYEDAKLCRKFLGYNANALYPSTMLGEMPFRSLLLATNGKGAQKLPRSFEARQVVWVRRSRHQGANRIVVHFRRNAADLLQQTSP